MSILRNINLKSRIACIIALLFAFQVSFASGHEEAAGEEKGSVDVKELVFGHISDAYSWHITTIGETHVEIPLPVIVMGNDGSWHVFSSSRFHHGHEQYEGFFLSKSEDNAGKVVELVNGEEVRPLDLSITKNVLSLFISCALILWIFLSLANKYKKNPMSSPTGFQALIEPLIMSIENEIIKGSIGKNYKKFDAYLLTVFFFIFINNLLGIVPIFPGGANLTGNIAATFVLAFITFLFTNLLGTKEYWKEVFWPEVPTWLKVPIPIMPLIEVIGIFTKPIALMVRLFANMLAGHMMVLVLIGLIFIFAAISPAAGGAVSVLSVLLVVFMTVLECLVCFIQAYVFTTLSAIFIGLAQVEPHHDKKH